MSEIEQRPDGVYLDMSFDDYLGQRRLSSSDLTHIMESPSAWWAQSWANPDKEEREETDAMKLGQAYHCARLEPDVFEERFCRELVPEDYGPELLTNGTQIGEALAARGEAKKKAGESVMDQALRLHDLDPTAKVWAIERLTWETQVKMDRASIAPKAWEEILRDAKRLRMNPEVLELFTGGGAEVSILWTDERTGAQLKCRPDWLGPDRVVHLKTWDSKAFGKPGNRAVVDALMYNGYARTGWFYLKGMEWLRSVDKLTIIGDKKSPAYAAIQDIRNRNRPVETWFAFVRRNGIPDIRARRIKYMGLPAGVEEQSIGANTAGFRDMLTGLGRKAHYEVEACLDAWDQAGEIYGFKGDPWFPRDMIGEIGDDDCSSYWLDSRDEPR